MTRPKPVFYQGQWVIYRNLDSYSTEPIKGQVTQVNWSAEDECWFYILKAIDHNSLVSFPGNNPKKMAAIRPWV